MDATRRSWHRHIGVLLAIVVASGAAPLASPAPAAEADDWRDDYVSSDSDGVEVSSDRYWTRAEMLAARPIPMPEESAPDLGSHDAPSAPDGPPGRIPPRPPAAPAERASASDPVGAHAPWFPFSLTPGQQLVPPYRQVGKLFFVMGGKTYVCSAVVISVYALFTAGHCVYDKPDGWATKVVFVPAYIDGRAPYGQWLADSASVPRGWKNLGPGAGKPYDYGGVVLKRFDANSPANKPLGLGKHHLRPIGQVVGSAGFAWNQDYEQIWSAVGYPANSPFNGQRMRGCTSPKQFTIFELFGAPRPVIGCNMKGGSSGGPWYIRDGGQFYVNSVSSTHLTKYDARLVGSYFNTATKNFRAELVSEVP